MKASPTAVVEAPLPPPEGPRWHVVECWSGREVLVVGEIEGLGLDTFLPLHMPELGGPLEPAFPGYVFVRFDQAEPAWRWIHSKLGVIQVLQHDAERPMVVADHVMAGLVGLYGTEGTARESRVPPQWLAVRLGAIVRVVDGPFAGRCAEVLQDLGARLRVAVAIFGRRTECELPRAAVAPL